VTLEILVSREARADIGHAVGGYRDISPTLSARFGAELDRIYSAIAKYPQMYPVVYKNFRRALLRKFPYSVFYIVEETSILIVGVVHQARDESTWKRRA
jgi:plasmid stabilization system protein ParE